MTNRLRLSPLLLCLALASACLNTAPEFTKEQARALSGVTGDGDDICALEGWYDDGVCDDFCPEADSDCVTCFASPVCDADELPHASLSACESSSSTCREVSLCDETIWCSPISACLAYPSCEAGETAYSSEAECPLEGVCTPRSLCSSTVWCHSADNCAALPVCGDGEIEYETLEECGGGDDCHAETLCGATIWCAPGAICLAVPVCDEGETAYDREADCPADAGCRRETVCGSTIWCSTNMCEGENPQGCVSGGCEEGFHCDTTMGSASSACTCGRWGWECTPDASGGVCIAD